MFFVLSSKMTNHPRFAAQRESLGTSQKQDRSLKASNVRELFDAFSVGFVRSPRSWGFTPGYYLCRLQRQELLVIFSN
jgi:hypothetical protein